MTTYNGHTYELREKKEGETKDHLQRTETQQTLPERDRVAGSWRHEQGDSSPAP